MIRAWLKTTSYDYISIATHEELAILVKFENFMWHERLVKER